MGALIQTVVILFSDVLPLPFSSFKMFLGLFIFCVFIFVLLACLYMCAPWVCLQSLEEGVGFPGS